MSGSLAAERQKLQPHKRFRPLLRREEILDELLDHYEEAQETQWSGQGSDDAADGGVRLMPSVWNESYRELERSLRRMENLAKPEDLTSLGFRLAYGALLNWYLRCEKHPVYDPVVILRRQKGGVLHEEERQPSKNKVVRWRIVRHANPLLVLRGIEWIAAEFVGEPFLPREILEMAA